MKASPILSLKNLFFSYGETSILEDVSLEIFEGEFVGIFGPNGGGKTTFLKLLMGFLKPSSGSISVLGSSPKKARTQIGYVPQISKMDKQFPITVKEVVHMGALSRLSRFGKISSEDKALALDCLKQVGLEGKKDACFGSLSGGETQRALIARALMTKPKLLILDEPTASVDPVAEEQILNLLSELKKQMTILMVTHDLQTILEAVGKLLCVHRCVHVHSPSAVCEHFGLGLYHSPILPKGDKCTS